MSGNWRAYFELLRLPAVFTAIADVMMGYLVTHGDLRPNWLSSLLVAASAMMYLAGMVLNDYYDADEDAIDRPGRPIPSGRISRATAGRLGWTLLLGGLLLAGITAWLTGDVGPVGVACFLAIFIYLYVAVVKSPIAGPLVMGCCRALNVLLGMSIVGVNTGTPLLGHWNSAELTIALGMWIYVAGITVFARGESGQSSRRRLAVGVAIMATGIVVLAAGACHVGNQSNYRWIVWLAIAAYVVIRHGRALLTPDPRAVQRSVRHALRMLIFLDFTVAFEAAPHSSGCLLILALFAPMLLLERWASTT